MTIYGALSYNNNVQPFLISAVLEGWTEKQRRKSISIKHDRKSFAFPKAGSSDGGEPQCLHDDSLTGHIVGEVSNILDIHNPGLTLLRILQHTGKKSATCYCSVHIRCFSPVCVLQVQLEHILKPPEFKALNSYWLSLFFAFYLHVVTHYCHRWSVRGNASLIDQCLW